MERVERMHWHLLAESMWHEQLSAVADAKIPRNLHGEERIDFYQARKVAQARLALLFPPDED